MFEGLRSQASGSVASIVSWVQDNSRAIRRGIATVILAVVAIGVLYLSYQLAGILATVLYAIMFAVGFSLLPGAIFVLRDMVPNFIGRLLFALGQLGFGGSWWVQTGEEWEVCPRRRVDGNEQYWYAGEWHTVADDSNMTRLGWAKFGITWHKTGDLLGRYRVDDQATDEYAELQAGSDGPDVEDIATMSPQEMIQSGGDGNAIADGGTQSLFADPPKELLDRPGVWVVNFNQFWADHMQEIGEPDLLDDVERVAQREEALAQTVNQNRLMIGSAFGLLLGAATGYVAMVGF